MSFNIEDIRNDFPALHQEINGKPLVYFDNAATSQKPEVVIESISNYYRTINSNVHRGVHHLSQQATTAFESARMKVKNYLNAASTKEIIITKGATESLNLVAHSFGQAFLHSGDEVLISSLEHHANIVPWQLICKEKNAILKVIPLNEHQELNRDAFADMLTDKVKIVAVSHISNAIGVVNPIQQMIELAHQKNIPVLIDGAQGIVHRDVDVQELDCDFYCFSSHKFYGPMGVGILYGKEKWLNQMPPYQTGGEMIKAVTFEETSFNELPYKFETGTPNVADVVGFEAAITYLETLGLDAIRKAEDELMEYALQQLNGRNGVEIFAPDAKRAGVISFNLKGIHPFDAGTIIDQLGIAVRTGNHCAQPLMHVLGIQGTIRASFAFYNTSPEIDRLIDAIRQVQKMFG